MGGGLVDVVVDVVVEVDVVEAVLLVVVVFRLSV